MYISSNYGMLCEYVMCDLLVYKCPGKFFNTNPPLLFSKDCGIFIGSPFCLFLKKML